MGISKKQGRILGYIRNSLKLGYAALKTGSECSLTTSQLRFFAGFCLA